MHESHALDAACRSLPARSFRGTCRSSPSVLIGALTELIVGAGGSSAKEKVERHEETLRAQPVRIGQRPH